MNFDSENSLAWKIVSLNSEEVDSEDVDDLDAVEQQRVLHLTSRERKRWHILLINNIKWNIKTKTDLYGELSFHLPWLVHLQLVDGRDDEGHCWDQDHCQGEERTKSEAEEIVIITMNEISNGKNNDSCHISKEQNLWLTLQFDWSMDTP